MSTEYKSDMLTLSSTRIVLSIVIAILVGLHFGAYFGWLVFFCLWLLLLSINTLLYINRG